MSLPSWGVVGTLDEPPELVAAYVAHHLAQGAGEVHVYLDRDDAFTRTMLATVPQVRVTVADEAYWRREFDIKLPKTHQRRQTLNATDAYRRAGVDFLLHLDADEFLVQHRPLDEELRRLRRLKPGNYLAIPNVERIYGPDCDEAFVFTELFRRSTKRLDGDFSDVNLDAEGLTLYGLTGHSEGKACSPTGYDYVLGIHRPHHDTDRPWTFPGMRRSRSAQILHFEGMTPLQWIYKRLRKAAYLEAWDGQPVTPQMTAQIAAINDAGGGISGARALHDRIKQADADHLAALDARDLIESVAFDPSGAVREIFPDFDLDLSAERFDRWLVEQKAEFFETLGLGL